MICNKCKEEKLESEFNFRNKGKGIRRKECKTCVKKYRKVYYNENKEKAIKYSLISTKNIRMRNRQYLWDYLKDHPCVDGCGNDNPIVLEFDHRDGVNKIDHVSRGSEKGWSLEKLQLEIDKCDVRCSNCHKIRTAKQFGWYLNIKK